MFRGCRVAIRMPGVVVGVGGWGAENLTGRRAISAQTYESVATR